MIVEYTLTPEDLRQGALAVAERQRERNQRRPRVWGFTGVIMVFYVAVHFIWRSIGATDEVIWFNLLLPAGVVMLAGLFLGLLALFRKGRFPRPGWRSAVSLGAIIILSGVIYLVYRISPKAHPIHWPDWTIILPHSTWLLFACIVIYFTSRGQTSQRIWDQNPELHSLQSTEITGQGIVISDAASRFEYPWHAFTAAIEMREVFLLFTSDRRALIIPKRALATDEYLNAMRAMMTHAKDEQPRGFPVQVTAAA